MGNYIRFANPTRVDNGSEVFCLVPDILERKGLVKVEI